MLNAEQIELLRKEIAPIVESSEIPESYGWPDQISMALVDAVFSIQAQYNPSHDFENPTGLLKRLRELKAAHPESIDDLASLVSLGSEELRAIMGDGKTSQESKADCAISAAENYLALGVKSSSDFDSRDAKHKKAYVSVRGLGPITYEYFTMLLGTPGVKSDTLITRFVNRTLRLEGSEALSSARVREALVETHKHFPDVPLNTFDNMIWRYESSRSSK